MGQRVCAWLASIGIRPLVVVLMVLPALADGGRVPATSLVGARPAAAASDAARQRADQPRRPSTRPAQGTSVGLASFMATSLDGRKTANGERFDSDEMVAAHRTYPFGTRLRVTNLENGRAVVVRVIDRMGPRRGRRAAVIDLSRAAAERLGFIKAGKARVRMEVVL